MSHRRGPNPESEARQIDSARVQALAREDFRDWEKSLPQLDDVTARRLWKVGQECINREVIEMNQLRQLLDDGWVIRLEKIDDGNRYRAAALAHPLSANDDADVEGDDPYAALAELISELLT